MPSSVSSVNLRALACLQRHGGHVVHFMNERPHLKSGCHFCGMLYDNLLGGPDPFVNCYTENDITLRVETGASWHVGRTQADLPVWYWAIHEQHNQR